MGSLVVGALAAIAFPFMMLRRRDPLVPPRLFRSRNFTVTNLSTLVIYGALYVSLTFQGIFLIGTLGYNEQAAGIAGLPATLLLVLFSTRFGKLAATVRPAAVHGGSVPRSWRSACSGSCASRPTAPDGSSAAARGRRSCRPPDYFVDLLPGTAVFGSGLMMMVAPLTTALMTSVPESNAGVASAINNAISRVGSPLVTAVIFVAVASSFYSSIARQVPDTDVDSSAFRADVSPLNQPSATCRRRSAPPPARRPPTPSTSRRWSPRASCSSAPRSTPWASATPGPTDVTPGRAVSSRPRRRRRRRPGAGVAEGFSSGEHPPHEPTGPRATPSSAR